MTEEAQADPIIEQVSGILSAAGFTPMPEGALEGVYAKLGANGYVIGGVHEAVGEVHAWDAGLSKRTTNDPVEAAHNLAAYIRAKLGNPLTTEATLEPVAVLSEAEETAAHEQHSELHSDGGSGAHETVGESDGAGGDDRSGEGAIFPELLGGPSGTIDADFEDAPDLGAELLEDEDFTLPELPAPEPLDFAPDEIEPEDHSPGAFIFGDNLAHDRIVRIGQLSERATELIAAAKAGYSDNEHDAVRSHVVTNMNEAGAYVGGRQDLFDRFIELETVTGLIRRIEMHRDERQDFIRSADREAVAAFEPAAGWP
jgi:hypothetical protein